MANYQVVDADQLEADLTGIADAIREKTEDTEKLSMAAMAQTIRAMPGLITTEAAGESIVLTDATDLKLRGLSLYGKTTQDGTPTPEVPVPLVSAGDGGSVGVTVAGKNLAESKCFPTAGSSGNFFLESLTPITSPATRKNWRGVSIVVPVLPNTVYTISSNITPTPYFNVTYYQGMDAITSAANAINKDEVQNANKITVTTPADCHCIVATALDGVETTYTWNWWQVEAGEVATAYEPYKEQQTLTLSTPNGLPGIPVTSGGNYTDSTGQQWVCDEVDLARGVYVQRVDRLVLTGNESLGHAGSVGTEGFYCFVNRTGSRGDSSGVSISNYFPGAPSMLSLASSNDQSRINTVSGGMGTAFPRLCLSHALLGTTAASSVSEARNAVIAWLKFRYSNGAPVVIASRLEAPMETPLSAEELAAYALLHTNYPNTTIFNDSGAGMAVKYAADTKLYIDQKFDQLAAALVNN